MQNTMKPINSPDGLFHDGNPYTGELGTVVTSEWLNNVQSAAQSCQDELLTVIRDSGQSADPARKDQLLQSLKKLAGRMSWWCHRILPRQKKAIAMALRLVTWMMSTLSPSRFNSRTVRNMEQKIPGSWVIRRLNWREETVCTGTISAALRW